MFLFDKSFNRPARTKRSAASAGRKLRIELLENRELLSVSTAEFDAIRSTYSDLDLSGDMSDYNIIDFTVDQLNETNLRHALLQAASSEETDLIVFRTGSTSDAITLQAGELGIDIDAYLKGGVVLVSLGESNLVLDGNGKSRVFNIADSSVALGGVEVRNGLVEGTENAGGGILAVNSDVIIAGSILYENVSGDYGGAVMAIDSNLAIYGTLISGNTTGSSGGGVCFRISGAEDKELYIYDSVLHENVVTGESESGYADGGALSAHLSGLPEDTGTYYVFISNTEVSDNRVLSSEESFGGGLSFEGQYFNNPLVELEYVTISGNSAHHEGGGLYLWNVEAVLDDCGIVENTAHRYGGGGIGIVAGSLDMFGCDVSRNVFNTFSDGDDAVMGGGIAAMSGQYNYDTDIEHVPVYVKIVDSTIADNMTAGGDAWTYGGGIFIADYGSDNSYLDLYGTSVVGNVAASGGGIDAENVEVSLSRCVISGNAAFYDGSLQQPENPSYGGGIDFFADTYGMMRIDTCVISGNYSDYAGGGISTTGTSADVEIVNSTIVGNTAFETGSGIYASVDMDDPVRFLLANSIAASNYAEDLYFDDFDADSGQSVPFIDILYCFIGSPFDFSDFVENNEGNIFEGGDPLFADFDVDSSERDPENWSPDTWERWNLRPTSDSPVVNAGYDYLVSADFDLDGTPRIVDGTVDMGAYEFISEYSAPILTGSLQDDGVHLSWTGMADTEYYSVWRLAGDTWTVLEPETTSNAIIDKTAPYGLNEYVVYAHHGTEKTISNLYSIELLPDGTLGTPTLSAKRQNGNVNLSWTNSVGATHYSVWRLTDDTWTVLTPQTTSTFFTDTTAAVGTHTYVVYAHRGTDKTMSNAANVHVDGSLGTPSLSASQQSDGVNLSWTNTAGAMYYSVWRLTDDTWTVLTPQTTSTSFTDTTAATGMHTYVVYAHRGTEKTMSDAESVTVTGTLGVPVLSVSQQNGNINLSWTDTVGAEHYSVWRLTDDTWTALNLQTISTYFVDTTASIGTHRYVVYAHQGTEITMSNIPSATVESTLKPPSLSFALQNNNVNLSWTNSVGATHYSVWRLTGDTWTALSAQTTSNFFIDTSAPAGTHRYVVYAHLGRETAMSDILSVTVAGSLGTPWLSASRQNDNVNLAWTAATGAEYYSVWRLTDETWTALNSKTISTYFVDTTAGNGTHHYVVYAHKGTETTMSNIPTSIVTNRLMPNGDVLGEALADFNLIEI